MSRSHIDHLVVTSPSLETGAEFIRQTLGVAPQAGGEHPRMGTHNLLLRLGDALYLEVISVNSKAPAPGQPRWFGLDHLDTDSVPTLSTWVVRTADIHSTASGSGEPLGTVESMSRGALNWLITIPADGCVPIDGVAPALIEWHTDAHPAEKLQDHGLSLNRLDIFHPDPARVSRLLSSIDLDGPVVVSAAADGTAPRLVAHINTPQGLRVLSA